MERTLVVHAGLAYRGIATGQLRGKNPLTVLRNVGKMMAGFQESLAIIREFQPDVCLATGGYVCAPVIAACRLQGIPVMIYLPDMVPGWAIRTLSIFAQRVAVTYAEVAPYFGGEYPTGKSVVTGYPVRRELVDAVGGAKLAAAEHARRRADARRELALRMQITLDPEGITESVPLLLVSGGSQGSRNINHAIWQALPALLPNAQILHVIGNRDWAMWQERLSNPPVDSALWQRYHPVAYLHEEMTLALAAADLTVARAGASTLGEFPVAHLPAILIPHPGVNQRQNAEQLVAQGGALMVEDNALSHQLIPKLLTLLQQPKERHEMEAALATVAKPNAARTIAKALIDLATEQY